MRAYRKIEDGYESKLEPGRMVLLGIGILLTVILVFLVGVLVGKGLWASKSPAPSAQAEGRPEPAPGAVAGGPKYTFYDSLKQPDSREVPAPSPLPPSASDTATTPIAAPRTEALPEVPKTDRPGSPSAGANADSGPRPGQEQAAAQTLEKHTNAAVKTSAAAEKPEPVKAVAEKAEPTKPAAEKKPRPSPVPEASAPKEKAPAQADPKKEVPKEGDKKPAEKPSAKAKEVSQAETKSKTAEKQKPPAPAASPKPETKLPTASFTVQIGSYKEKGPAEKQVREMAAQGIDAHVLAVPIQGRTWYRVQVGQFATRAEADAHFKKKMKPKGVQGFVTPR